jgi:hypothetical protein
MSPSLSEKVLEKIKNDQVKPKASWKFSAERYTILFLLGLSLLVGSIAFGIVLELISKLELFSIWSRVRNSAILIRSFPYLWIAVMFVSLILVYAEFLRTRHGYRYHLRDIAFYAASIIMGLGLLMYKAGFAETAEYALESHLPLYQMVMHTPKTFWQQPDDGLLSGTIVRHDEAHRSMDLEDMNQEVWIVDYSGAFIGGRVVIRQGEVVRVIGERKGQDRFKAEMIKPLPPCQMCQMKGNEEVRGMMRERMLRR